MRLLTPILMGHSCIHTALSVRLTRKKTFILLDNQVAVGALMMEKSSSSLLITWAFYEVAHRTNAEVRCVLSLSNNKVNVEVNAEAALVLSTLLARNIQPSYMINNMIPTGLTDPISH